MAEILAGGYNTTERAGLVNKRLIEELQMFESHDFIKNGPLKLEEKQISQVKSLETLQKEIEDIGNAVDSIQFEGKHFTKEYRTYHGTCNKLLLELDNIVKRNEDHELVRKRGISHVNGILNKLKDKVHKDGQCCKKCELYGTIWQ